MEPTRSPESTRPDRRDEDDAAPRSWRFVVDDAPYHGGMADETGQLDRRTGWSRPVSVPADVDDPTLQKARGFVELPRHVHWSGPTRRWDLDDRREKAQVYEIVLSEGTDDDVRRLIDVDDLLDLWDEMWLAPHVRRAWAPFLHRVRGVQVTC